MPTEMTTHRSPAGKVSAAVFAVALAILLTPNATRTVMTPLALGGLVALSFVLILSSRSSFPPVGEIGTWFVAAVTVYMSLPLIIYLLIGQEYTLLNDNRLAGIQPTPEDVAAVAWLYLAFLGPFALTYLAVRGRVEPTRMRRSLVSKQRIGIMIGLWVAMSLPSLMLAPTMAVDSYQGSYAAMAALPLWLRQILKLSSGWSIILALGLRVWLFQDFAKRKWLILGWIAYDVVLAFTVLGARTSLVLSVGSCFILYHLLVRPVSMKVAMLAGVGGLTVFLGLGLLRALQGIGPADLVVGNLGGEFEAIFATAVELRRLVAAGAIDNLPLQFHLADLLSSFPSQILPFQKIDPGHWYVFTFFPVQAELGAGLAFGVVAQGIVGLGWIELVLRGCILGAAFATLHRYFARNSDRFWAVVLYVWATVWAYQSFRDQSFILSSFFVQQFLTLVVLVEGLQRVFRRAGSREYRADPVLAATTETTVTS